MTYTGPTPAALAAIAGVPDEEIVRLDALYRIVHHMRPDQEVPTCGAGPLDWWRANANPQLVDCVPCLRRLL